MKVLEHTNTKKWICS